MGFLKVLDGVRKNNEVARQFMKDASCIKGYITGAGACAADKIRIEIGCNLISLVIKEKGAELMEGISNLRKTISFPQVQVTDNLRLNEDEYRILVRGREIFRGQCMSMPYFSQENAGIIVNKLKKAIEDYHSYEETFMGGINNVL
jgi:flagellar biosynthesis component FlhA